MFRSLKAQVYMLAFVPFIFVGLVSIVTQIQTLNTVNKDMSKISEETIINVEKKRLVTVIDSSLSIIQPYIDKPGNTGMKEALDLLFNYRYDNNVGYLFAYDGDGNRLMSGSGVGVGGNYINSKDKHGNLIVQNILTAAQSGEGFTTYYFPKAGEKEPSAKYSYAVWIEKWGIAIATGFFIDGIDSALININTSLIESEKKSLTTKLIIIGLLSGLVAIIVFLAVRSILSALHALRDAVEDLADGEGDLTATLPGSSLDVLDDTSKHFNRFLASMSKDIQSLKNAGDQLKDIALVSREQHQRLADDSDSQIQETTSTAAAIEEMSSTALEIANNAELTRTSAENTDKEVQEMLVQIQISGKELDALTQVLNSVEGSVQELGGNVDDINSVLSVIQDISEQTNLLALNAAIEAARAGELGRGFAVVADEVRTLAQRSQQSTEEIKTILDKLQTSAEKTIQDMANTTEKRTSVVQAMETITGIIHSSSKSMKELTAMNVDVSNAASQQSDVVNDMSKNIADIAQLAETIGQSSQQTSDQFARLEKQSENIQAVTRKFKT